MKWIIIKYAYKRFWTWYIGTYVTRTRLKLDKTTLQIILPEIKQKEMIEDVVILEGNYE